MKKKTSLHKGGKDMAKRTPVKPAKDKAIFTRTAKKTKKVNIAPKTMRGGIRF